MLKRGHRNKHNNPCVDQHGRVLRPAGAPSLQRKKAVQTAQAKTARAKAKQLVRRALAAPAAEAPAKQETPE